MLKIALISLTLMDHTYLVLAKTLIWFQIAFLVRKIAYLVPNNAYLGF